MRELFLIAMVAFHAVPVFAGDNSCLKTWQEWVANSQIEWPKAVLEQAGLTQEQVQMLPKKSESFYRSYMKSRNEVSEISYAFQIPAGKLSLSFLLELSPLPDSADSEIGFKLYYRVQRPDFSRDMELFINGTLSRRCEVRLWEPTETHYVQDLVKGVTTIKSTVTKGSTSATTEKTVDSEGLRLNFRLENTTLRERDQAGFDIDGNKLYGRLAEWSATAHRVPDEPHRVFNPWTKSIEKEALARTYNIQFEGQDKPAVYRASAGSEGYELFDLTFSEGGTLTLERIDKESWMKSVFRRRKPTFWPWTAGFEAKDLTGSTLTYQMAADQLWKPPENFVNYVSLSGPQYYLGSNLWTVTVEHKERPTDVAVWRGTEQSGGPDLESTLLVDLQAAKEIADSMRSSLKGQDRLEVAAAISKRVRELMQYDSNALETGSVDKEDLKKILSEKKGVCQHFAALFQGIARNLGIPTRLVFGYLVGLNEAGGHAWVEIKINDKTWWPLDPTLSDGDSLPSLAYFPTGVAGPYLARTEKELSTSLEEYTESLNKIQWFRKHPSN